MLLLLERCTLCLVLHCIHMTSAAASSFFWARLSCVMGAIDAVAASLCAAFPPAPAPAPSAKMAKVLIMGRVPVEVRGSGGTIKGSGDLPAGAYEIWANFGEGMTRASSDSLILTEGSTQTIKCSTLKFTCELQ